MYARRAQKYAAPGDGGGPIITDGLVSRWAIDEGSGGTIADTGSNGYDGVIENFDGTGWVASIAPISQAAFDTDQTVDPYLLMTNDDGRYVWTVNDVKTTGLTLCVFASISRAIPDHNLYALFGGKGEGIGWTTGGIGINKGTLATVFFAEIWNGSSYVKVEADYTQHPIGDDVSTSLIAVFDTGLDEIRIYQDGDLVGTAASAGLSGVSIYPKWVTAGDWKDRSQAHLSAVIDDCRAYIRVLSDSEILQVAQGNG